ncbi:hypothetical protein ElyMa_000068300 [Elysia marginata]|uniref:Uncharacterized protein n=1 Tax=Elysia marginata TaxID=1093978 RepID=A0AAV4EHQ9_9GAST|nr:hypothetical protein ElyMa_000068300 [Elysia marginata]
MNAITLSLCLVVVATTVYAGNPQCLAFKDKGFPQKCASRDSIVFDFCCEKEDLWPVSNFVFDEKTFDIHETCECKTIDEICKTDNLQCSFLKNQGKYRDSKTPPTRQGDYDSVFSPISHLPDDVFRSPAQNPFHLSSVRHREPLPDLPPEFSEIDRMRHRFDPDLPPESSDFGADLSSEFSDFSKLSDLPDDVFRSPAQNPFHLSRVRHREPLPDLPPEFSDFGKLPDSPPEYPDFDELRRSLLLDRPKEKMTFDDRLREYQKKHEFGPLGLQ